MSTGELETIEELAWKLLSTLPRSRLAAVHRRLNPLLQFDIIGTLPNEVALQIFANVPYKTLLTCSLVCKRWQLLTSDQTLWKQLCLAHGWTWRPAIPLPQAFDRALSLSTREWDQSEDEGMGDSDSESDVGTYIQSPDDTARADSSVPPSQLIESASTSRRGKDLAPRRPAAPSATLMGYSGFTTRKADYKLLHQTHIRLQNRFADASYRLSVLQTRGAPASGHSNTIYCLQLYTDPESGRQLLFTGSRDKTVRQWCLETRLVERVISDIHTSSVLSICVRDGYLASAGSDQQVALWDLRSNKLVKTIREHDDSVLCVRFDKNQLVSCSKDRTIRVYTFPDLKLRFVLDDHRAAVNAVSISDSYIVSGSGDRSVKLWDANTGKLLRSFDNHHTRGIASIDFKPPLILSGSSDKHLRVFDISNLQGWSTSPEAAVATAAPFPLPHASEFQVVCQACGSGRRTDSDGEREQAEAQTRCMHGNLVRTVSLGADFVVSGSYDLSIKVWDKKTGKLVADLTGGHTGRIFCVDFDRTKVVSCGEDQRVCVWDFSHGIDTSFLNLS